MAALIQHPVQICDENSNFDFPYKVDVDHILKHHAGNVGFVQVMMILIGAVTLPPAIIFPVFGNTELKFRCRLDRDSEKYLESRFQESLIDPFDEIAASVGPWPHYHPPEINAGHDDFGCRRFKHPPIWPTYNNPDRTTIPCDKGYVYKYAPESYPRGIVVEWDLICERAWLAPFSTSMYMVGMMVGFISGGIAGDHFGRKRTLLLACLIEAASIVGVSLSKYFWHYVLARFILASASSIRISLLLVLCMEMTTARQRSIINGIWSVVQCCLLRIIISPLAYLYPNWRKLHAAICVLSFFSFPFICMFPESPRWLVSQHRKREALHQLHRIYVVNRGMKCKCGEPPLLSEEEFICLIRREAAAAAALKSSTSKPVPSGPKKSKLKKTLQSFKNVKMVRMTFQCVLLFAGQLATTFGLLFYGNAIRINIYIVNCLNSSTQIPATILSAVMYRFCKRRKLPILLMYTCSLTVLSVAMAYDLVAKPQGDMVLNICCNLSLILLAAALNMVFMYVPELFASEARTLGLGVASGLGRIGGVLCPFINALDSRIFHGFPIFIYIGIHVLELINLLWLPDTSGRNLLDNYEEEIVIDEQSEFSIRQTHIQEESHPIWASTMGELIASTQVIGANSDSTDDECDEVMTKQ